MSKIRHLLRLLTIARVLIRNDLAELVKHMRLLGPLRHLLLMLPRNWSKREKPPMGVRIRRALEDLGPVFIKFGQALSTRPDLLPAPIARELAKLQDQVPPFDGQQAREVIETAYGQPVEALFLNFDATPLASASVAQVHTAQTLDGKDVVIKVLRPGVETTIDRDVGVLHAIAELAQRYWAESRRLRPVDVVNEYEKTIYHELDLMREAANAAQLRRNFEQPAPLYVPDVYWDLCRERVMVIERINGVPIGDIETLKANNVNMEQLARYGVEIFFTQVFRDNFFHADMHPGNIFVDISDPNNPTYIAVDFGIVGTLTRRDQHYLASNLLAFFHRDYRRVAELHVESGWVPPDTRADEFEAAIRTVCEPIFNKPLAEISFGHFLIRLFQTARQFNMEVQPQLVLLQKTLLNIEGLGRQLYPQLDLWDTAKPFLEDWMADQLSGREVLERLRDGLPQFRENIQAVPQLALDALTHLAAGKVKLALDMQPVHELERTMLRTARQRHASTAGAALIVSGTIWLASAGAPTWPGWAGIAAGLAALVFWRPR